MRRQRLAYERRHYAGVLLISVNGNCILQLRERKSDISNAGLITTFGGTVEPGETALECALREIQEELCLSLRADQTTLLMEADLATDGEVRHFTIFIGRNIDPQSLCLQEGEAIEILSVDECMAHPRLSPLCRKVIEFYAFNKKQ